MTRTLWCCLFAGHLAWSVHLLASYFLATAACAADPAGLPAWRHALTVAAAGVTAAAVVAAALVSARSTAGAPAGDDVQRYAAGLTLALNAMFSLAILLAGVTGLFVPACV